MDHMGAGYRGRLLLQYIKKIELSEVYFADNDVEKIGKVMEGIVCLSRDEVQEMANDSIILVSPQKVQVCTRICVIVVRMSFLILYWRFWIIGRRRTALNTLCRLGTITVSIPI